MCPTVLVERSPGAVLPGFLKGLHGFRHWEHNAVEDLVVVSFPPAVDTLHTKQLRSNEILLVERAWKITEAEPSPRASHVVTIRLAWNGVAEILASPKDCLRCAETTLWSSRRCRASPSNHHERAGAVLALCDDLNGERGANFVIAECLLVGVDIDFTRLTLIGILKRS